MARQEGAAAECPPSTTRGGEVKRTDGERIAFRVFSSFLKNTPELRPNQAKSRTRPAPGSSEDLSLTGGEIPVRFIRVVKFGHLAQVFQQ
jgi:hypothetical protein